jgi:hypothetical protein
MTKPDFKEHLKIAPEYQPIFPPVPRRRLPKRGGPDRAKKCTGDS